MISIAELRLCRVVGVHNHAQVEVRLEHLDPLGNGGYQASVLEPLDRLAAHKRFGVVLQMIASVLHVQPLVGAPDGGPATPRLSVVHHPVAEHALVYAGQVHLIGAQLVCLAAVAHGVEELPIDKGLVRVIHVPENLCIEQVLPKLHRILHAAEPSVLRKPGNNLVAREARVVLLEIKRVRVPGQPKRAVLHLGDDQANLVLTKVLEMDPTRLRCAIPHDGGRGSPPTTRGLASLNRPAHHFEPVRQRIPARAGE